jgi:hypothetical protein
MIPEGSPLLEPLSAAAKIQNCPQHLFFLQPENLFDHTYHGVASCERCVWHHLRIGFDGIWSLRTFRDCLADELDKFSYAEVVSRRQRM